MCVCVVIFLPSMKINIKIVFFSKAALSLSSQYAKVSMLSGKSVDYHYFTGLLLSFFIAIFIEKIIQCILNRVSHPWTSPMPLSLLLQQHNSVTFSLYKNKQATTQATKGKIHDNFFKKNGK